MRTLFTLAAVAALFALATPTVLLPRDAKGAVIHRVDARYGDDPRQAITVWVAAHKGKAPLMLYFHGGGWAAGDSGAGGGAKPKHFIDRGYVYASATYRFVPQATVEDQLADAARAVRWLRANAGELGADKDRIVLVGHSSGAHLAAMIASDPQWLAAAKVPFAAIRAVVLLDGAGFDVPTLMAPYPGTTMPFYGLAFGADAARQLRLSPIAHLAPPNAPAWLFLQDASRFSGYAEAEALAGPLRKGGATTLIVPVAGTSHMQLNENLGLPGDPATDQADAFLATIMR